MVWLSGGEKDLMICSAVSAQYRHVTGGRTDKRTDILVRQTTSCEKCMFRSAFNFVCL